MLTPKENAPERHQAILELLFEVCPCSFMYTRSIICLLYTSIQHFGGAQIQVLNTGKSYGYLRLVPAGKENSFRPQARDIVIYEQLPKRLFPVSGIISLEPQHELSHINLLAKNRGTVNLSLLELEALPNAVSLQGKLVQLACERGKVMLVPANEKEAERFWSLQKKSLQIPKRCV